MPDFDVLIIGAGLSGVGMACHLVKQSPQLKFGLVERRQAVGGTWDLFRYPGIRSDSDMFTFGYTFRPWNSLKTLADGPSIRGYIEDTAREHKIMDKIQFGLRTTKACWSSKNKLWTVHALDQETGKPLTLTSKFLISCTGYYNHDAGYQPEFPGLERFQGSFIHPQQWPENLSYKGKRVLIIGSGATAVTLVPAMADEAAHVTMLQRSPTYIMTIPAWDKLSEILRRFLPDSWVFSMARNRNLFLQRAIYKASKRWPEKVRSFLLSQVRKQVGPDVDMCHFTPKYMPWDERLCAVPDGDLFKVVREGKASIATDKIESFTETGVQLQSGQHLEADIIISATGLQLQMLGGTEIFLDDKPVTLRDRVTYKGVMGEGIPNMGWIFGYTNAPWTLKADLAATYLCRLLNYMGKHKLAVVVPEAPTHVKQATSVMDNMQAGYVQRADSILPRQGSEGPWRVLNDFKVDQEILLHQPVEDSALRVEVAIPS